MLPPAVSGTIDCAGDVVALKDALLYRYIKIHSIVSFWLWETTTGWFPGDSEGVTLGDRGGGGVYSKGEMYSIS